MLVVLVWLLTVMILGIGYADSKVSVVNWLRICDLFFWVELVGEG